MAIGKASDFKVYQEEFFGGMNEVLMQNADAFNGSSGGAIRFVTQARKGDYVKESFFKSISGLITRRVTTSVAAATDLMLEQGENAAVKVNRKIGPVAQTRDAFRKIGMSPQEMSVLLGAQWGRAVTLDYLNTSIIALAAALSAQSGVVTDKSAASPTTMTHGWLSAALAKFGDNSDNIVAWVMHSKVYFDLLGQAITDKITNIADGAIKMGQTPALGRPVIITDSSALVIDGTPDDYVTLGLVAGGAVVEQSEQQEIVSDDVTGLENLVLRIQGEYAFNVGLKGFSYDYANGGANPTDGTIGTASNWDKTSADDKSLAGIYLLTK